MNVVATAKTPHGATGIKGNGRTRGSLRSVGRGARHGVVTICAYCIQSWTGGPGTLANGGDG